MWKSRLLLAGISKELWEGWEACFWLSTLSIVPAFPPLSLFPSGAWSRKADYKITYDNVL